MNQVTLKKYHGLGNDYLVLDPNKNELALQTRNIEMLCRRNFGVGADGLLYGPVWEDGRIRVRIFNSDGSEAERSGNGVRIFAKYLLDEGYVKDNKFTLDMLAGEVEVEFLQQDGSLMRVNMGKPGYAGAEMPLTGLDGEIVNAHLRFQDNIYNTTCLSVGNPNCVIMMEEVTPQKAKDLGPYVEQASYFPNRINMQICKVVDRKNLVIEIYERGTGYTLASGTGACAAAAAAKRMGLVDEKVVVHMQGGDLTVEIDQTDTIYMTGSVEKVGTFTLAENFLLGTRKLLLCRESNPPQAKNPAKQAFLQVKYPQQTDGVCLSLFLASSPQGAGYLHPNGAYPRGIRQISMQAWLLS